LLVNSDSTVFPKFSNILDDYNYKLIGGLKKNLTLENSIADMDLELDILEKYIRKNQTSSKPKIIVDIKDTSVDYILRLKELGLIVIDFEDLGAGRDYVDLLIDANIHHFQEISENSNKLFGSDYVCLAPIFRDINQLEKKINNEIKDILIFFGGSDPSDIANFLLANIESCNFPSNARITIISNKITTSKKNQNINLKILDVNLTAKQMAELYYNSDICIISGGISMYESLVCGCPAIIINQNSEQHRNVSFFNDYIVNLGIFDKTKIIIELNKALEKLKAIDLRQRLSIAAKKKIDGLGINRIAKRILTL